MIAVHCHQLTKEFGTGATRTPVLRGIDLEIHTGAISMLVGPSGCGKTTLLSVIAGLLHPTTGQVSILGENLDALTPDQQAAFRRRNLGFVFQQYNLLPSLTALENAAIPLLADDVPYAEAVRRAGTVLDRLDMSHRANALPSELSGGQQQRVAIARALVHDPTILICDEPTAALDAQTGLAVMELLSAVAVAPTRAVLIVTHDNRIFPFAHVITHMEDGRITHTQLNPPPTH